MLIKSVVLFVVAGLFEIGGGYLVWQWWRNGAGFVLGALGGFILFLYGIIPTYQPQNFGRVYAAYGGWFVVLSILWGWGVDRPIATMLSAPWCVWRASLSSCTRPADSVSEEIRNHRLRLRRSSHLQPDRLLRLNYDLKC